LPIKTYRGVQSLRFVSAVLVVAVHACRWFNRDAAAGAAAPEGELLGDLCVATFFLISGFVVVHVVRSGHEPDWKTFALRRAIRILPLAWAMTTIKVVAAVLAPDAMFDGGLTPTRIVASFLLVPSRDPEGMVRLLWGVEWTLVFEMAFYVLVAIAIAIRLDPIVLATPVILMVAGLSIWRPVGGSVLWFYADPIILFLAAGMWIAQATHTMKAWPASAVTLAAALLYATAEALRGDSTSLVAGLVFAAVTGVFALLVIAEPYVGKRIPRWLVLGGDTAFALYLTHPLVAQVLPRVLGRLGVTEVPWFPVVLVSIALSIGLGWFVHRRIDMPLGRLLRGKLIRPRSPRPLETR
jgi:exopolysaccharide production protein ExoZ